MLDIGSTDQAFTDSPDAGDPACTCSRCLELAVPALDDDTILRMQNRVG